MAPTLHKAVAAHAARVLASIAEDQVINKSLREVATEQKDEILNMPIWEKAFKELCPEAEPDSAPPHARFVLVKSRDCRRFHKNPNYDPKVAALVHPEAYAPARIVELERQLADSNEEARALTEKL